MRRLLVLVATAALLAAVPGAAMAASGQIRVAGDGAVDKPTDVTVHVDLDTINANAVTEDCGEDGGLPLLGGSLLEEVCSVTLTMARRARSGPGYVRATPRGLDCHSNCDRRTNRVYGPVKVDPTDAGPFQGIPPGERCNGRWTMAADITSSGGEETVTRPVVLSGPPTAPTDVSVDPGTDSAKISWKPAELGDITGHVIQRNAGSGWQRAGTTGGNATSFTDGDAPGGKKVTYRVMSQRADGFVAKQDGQGEVAVNRCGQDEGRDLSSAQHPDASLRYGTASGEIQAAPSPGSGATATAGGGGSAAAGSSSGGSAGGGDGSTPSEEESELPAYGEGMEFNRELDFGQGGSQGTPDDEVVLQDDLASGGIERYLDPERIAVPIALGLILIVVGAHIRAWMNAAVPDRPGGGSSSRGGGGASPPGGGGGRSRTGRSGWWGSDS